MDSGWRDGASGPSDEFDYSSGVPTRRVYPVENTEPGGDFASENSPKSDPEAAVRLAIPGAFLIFSGILNLLIGVLFLFIGITLINEDPAELLARIRQENPKQAEILEAQLAQGNMTWERAVSLYQTGFLVAGGLGFIAGILGIIGGRAMTTRVGHGAALAGALATAIPCVTPMGCLLLGPIFGFWALIVLMREDSWEAFGR